MLENTNSAKAAICSVTVMRLENIGRFIVGDWLLLIGSRFMQGRAGRSVKWSMKSICRKE